MLHVTFWLHVHTRGHLISSYHTTLTTLTMLTILTAPPLQRWLAETHFEAATFVYDYPRHIKVRARMKN